jgi:hypothetical protein
MNKFVIKTTKTFKYDDKGFLIEEVVTQEEYTEEIQEVKTKTKTFGDYHKVGEWKKAKGPKQSEKEPEVVYGKRSSVGKSSGVGNSIDNITVNVDNKSIDDIMNEIKAHLEQENRTSL